MDPGACASGSFSLRTGSPSDPSLFGFEDGTQLYLSQTCESLANICQPVIMLEKLGLGKATNLLLDTEINVTVA